MVSREHQRLVPNVPDMVSPLLSPSDSTWKMIASGAHHAGLLDGNGTLYMYGLNDSGRLGLTEIAKGGKRGHEDVYQLRPVHFPGNSKVASFSCGHSSGRYCCLEIKECSNQRQPATGAGSC